MIQARKLRQIRAHDDEIRWIYILDDGIRVVSVSGRGDVAVHNIKGGGNLHFIPVFDEDVSYCCLCDDT